MIKNGLRNRLLSSKNYSEFRVQENKSHTIVMVMGNIIKNIKGAKSGFSTRVFDRGAWGFASSPEISDASIKKTIEAAERNATFLANRKKLKLNELTHLTGNENIDFSTKKARVSEKEKIDFIKNVDNYIAEKYPDLLNRTLYYSYLDMEKELVTSNGTIFYSKIPRTMLFIILSMEDKEGNPIEIFDIASGRGDFEDVLINLEEVYKKVDKAYIELREKVEGVYAESGVKECVLDSKLAGILAHEAIGHTTEADGVLGGSVAGDYLGKKCASELVTLIDFAHTANGVTCPMPIYVDDEGTLAEDAVIIQDGVLRGYMHNKESAALFGVKPQGNARAFEFSDEPLIRMRNTAILPGDSKLEEMIASVKDGYYMITPGNGQADSTSEFMFAVTKGYEIKDGKLGRAIKDTTISGVAFDVLKSVSMISDDMTWSGDGMCGKKQPIPTGMGGPAIKCNMNIGGR